MNFFTLVYYDPVQDNIIPIYFENVPTEVIIDIRRKYSQYIVRRK